MTQRSPSGFFFPCVYVCIYVCENEVIYMWFYHSEDIIIRMSLTAQCAVFFFFNILWEHLHSNISAALRLQSAVVLNCV